MHYVSQPTCTDCRAGPASTCISAESARLRLITDGGSQRPIEDLLAGRILHFTCCYTLVTVRPRRRDVANAFEIHALDNACRTAIRAFNTMQASSCGNGEPGSSMVGVVAACYPRAACSSTRSTRLLHLLALRLCRCLCCRACYTLR